MTGPYDNGYRCCDCFWGRSPGSFVRRFISEIGASPGMLVLDLGCGEGKNAHALARLGAHVVAVDSSHLAVSNGKRAFPHDAIEWVQSDAESYLESAANFDLIIMYGLLHCLPSAQKIQSVIHAAWTKTKRDGHHIVVAFNDGPQDLAAHPGFHPTLVPHHFYLDLYKNGEMLAAESEVIHETHPHNLIPHFHSITRLIVRRTR